MAAAGKDAGTDFGCINIPGTKAVVVTVDAWGFSAAVRRARRRENKIRRSGRRPGHIGRFAAKKGSTPVVLNAPTDKLDECNQVALDTLKDPANRCRSRTTPPTPTG